MTTRLDMLPGSARYNLPNSGRIDTILIGKLSKAMPITINLTDCYNVFCGQTGVGIAGPVIVGMAFATLYNLVVRIGLVTAKPKVFRITASGVITTMANDLILWYRAIGERIYQSMCCCLLAKITDNAITCRGVCASPEPASIIATPLYPRPQSLFNGLCAAVARLMTGKKAVRLTGNIAHSSIGSWRDVGPLPATTVTEAFRHYMVHYVLIIRTFVGICKWQPSM